MTIDSDRMTKMFYENVKEEKRKMDNRINCWLCGAELTPRRDGDATCSECLMDDYVCHCFDDPIDDLTDINSDIE